MLICFQWRSVQTNLVVNYCCYYCEICIAFDEQEDLDCDFNLLDVIIEVSYEPVFDSALLIWSTASSFLELFGTIIDLCLQANLAFSCVCCLLVAFHFEVDWTPFNAMKQVMAHKVFQRYLNVSALPSAVIFPQATELNLTRCHFKGNLWTTGFAIERCSGGNLVSSIPIHGWFIHFVSSVGCLS